MWLEKIDASAYIIDCNWCAQVISLCLERTILLDTRCPIAARNMNQGEISQKTAPLVKQLRSARPTTPIILAEGSPDGDLWFGEPSHQSQQQNNEALRAAYEQLKPQDAHLHYVESAELFGLTNADHENPTVGGCHPSDLGAHDIASFWSGFLPTLLGNA